jgi:CheY-like chemotaxis protein/anti-sigma regulatory factor (Ser/Thr protein kinase)
VRNKGNQRWTFYISRRLNDRTGRFAGVILVGISCDFFTEFFRNVSLGEQAAISLYRRDNQVLTLHESGANRDRLRIALRVAEIPGMIEGDPARLRQVLGNLLSNAIKFTSSGVIEVTLEAGPEPCHPGLWRLRYSIKDSGIGIDAATMKRLFEPFSQADGISQRYGGSGLGLAICKRLVELMGGSIRCRSTPGAGSTFTVELTGRLLPSAAHAAAAPPAAPDAQAPGGHALVVDDTELNRQLALILLNKLGWTADEAENGQLALEALQARHYDLVLMDCMMPVMDGYEAVRRLRARETAAGSPRIPVLALTANVMDGDRERCLEAGADG